MSTYYKIYIKDDDRDYKVYGCLSEERARLAMGRLHPTKEIERVEERDNDEN